MNGIRKVQLAGSARDILTHPNQAGAAMMPVLAEAACAAV
jgi:hypothetical protein